VRLILTMLLGVGIAAAGPLDGAADAMGRQDWPVATAECEEAFASGAELPPDEVTLQCLNLVAAARFGGTDYATAEALWTQSLELGGALYGEEEPSLAIILGNRANARLRQARFGEAEDGFRAAIAQFGGEPSQPQVVAWTSLLAEALVGRGALGEAEAAHRQMLGLQEQMGGPISYGVVHSLTQIGGLQRQQGRFNDALQTLSRAVSVAEQLPDDGGYLALALGSLAEVHRESGHPRRALPLHARSLREQEARLGLAHPDVASTLVNQAAALRDAGATADAKAAYERARAIYEATLGPDHPYVATTLTSLAGLLQHLGDLEGARPLLTRSLAVYEATLGPDHEWVATALNNLAQQHLAEGTPQEAWPLLLRAIGIWDARLGPSHAHSLGGRNNAANALFAAGQHGDALALMEETHKLGRESLGADHPQVVQMLANVGEMRWWTGDPAGAQRAYRDAVGRAERRVGSHHPRVVSMRTELAAVLFAGGQLRPARAEMTRALADLQEHVQPLLDATSERERLALIRSLRDGLDLYLSMFSGPDDAAAAYAAVASWKGVGLRSLATQREAVLAAREPVLTDAFNALAAVRRELAAVALGDEPDLVAAAVLRERKESLERDLARRSRGLSVAVAPTPAALCAALGPDEALVDVLRYHRIAVGEGGRPESAADAYLAFVLPGGACDRPVRVELGPAAPLELAAVRWRRAVADGQGRRSAAKRSVELRAAVWDPIEVAVGARTRIWVVPDGALSSLPLGALQRDDGRFVLQDRAVARLASSSDLLRPPSEGAEGALVLGGVDYDWAGEGGPDRGDEDLGEATPAEPAVSLAPGLLASRGVPGGIGPFGPLPQTEAEAREVAAALSTSPVLGASATEAALRAGAPGARVVHIATHGFFVADRSALHLGAGAGANPMLLSGLALAGANTGGDGQDDGVLTAEEVVGLDLRGTELVVLSACETGLGEVADGEGVLGLQRAFAQAGARGLVMSLWSVPDAETRRLMTGFYERFTAGESPADALLGAQRDLITALQAERGDAPEFFWAAFVVSGR